MSQTTTHRPTAGDALKAIERAMDVIREMDREHDAPGYIATTEKHLAVALDKARDMFRWDSRTWDKRARRAAEIERESASREAAARLGRATRRLRDNMISLGIVNPKQRNPQPDWLHIATSRLRKMDGDPDANASRLMQAVQKASTLDGECRALSDRLSELRKAETDAAFAAEALRRALAESQTASTGSESIAAELAAAVAASDDAEAAVAATGAALREAKAAHAGPSQALADLTTNGGDAAALASLKADVDRLNAAVEAAREENNRMLGVANAKREAKAKAQERSAAFDARMKQQSDQAEKRKAKIAEHESEQAEHAAAAAAVSEQLESVRADLRAAVDTLGMEN
jgi:chromosome segregation ATPase